MERNFLDCFKKMADKLNMGAMASFNNANLKMETQENTLLAKDIIEEEKQAK